MNPQLIETAVSRLGVRVMLIPGYSTGHGKWYSQAVWPWFILVATNIDRLISFQSLRRPVAIINTALAHLKKNYTRSTC